MASDICLAIEAIFLFMCCIIDQVSFLSLMFIVAPQGFGLIQRSYDIVAQKRGPSFLEREASAPRLTFTSRHSCFCFVDACFTNRYERLKQIK